MTLGTYGCLIPVVISTYFMAFGNYVPDWKCFDPHINFERFKGHVWNETTKLKDNESEMSCEVFENCSLVEFDDGISTIVTEWNLLCSHQWVPSLIISLQMAGILIGSLCGGRLVDRIGRKCVLFGPLLINGVLSFIAAFSVNWQMFAALKFLIGIPDGAIISCVFFYAAEFLPIKWRGIVSTTPIWSICVLIFAAIIFALKDWKNIHIANGVIAILLCPLALWIPDSMRLMAVKGKLQGAEEVADKIARTNRKPIPELSVLNMIFENQRSMSETESKPEYSFEDIFRRGLYKRTLIMSFLWFSLVIIGYAQLFNVKGLYGDFFVNLALFACIPIMTYPLVLWVVEKPGRKIGIIVFVGLTSLSCFSIVLASLFASIHVRNICLTIFALVAFGSLECGWSVIMIYTYELFPTCVRGFGFGCASAASRLGGIIAPFLIPQNQDTSFIFYTIYGIASLVSCLLVLLLPETKGRPLEDTLDRRQKGYLGKESDHKIHDIEC